MTRKSTNTDLKLMEHGRKLMIKKGASKLSIREVATAAKVNLGMFNYHFQNKDNFIEKILDEIYQEFLSNLELVEQESDLESLENQLLVMSKFARDNRHLILVLLNDILNGEKAVQKFVRLKMKKHFMIISRTLLNCQKKGLLIDAPLPLLITQIAGSIGISNLMPEVIKHIGISNAFDLNQKEASEQLFSDIAIELRVRIVIKGLKK